MFEIPEGLHEDLYGLAWMIGRWEGVGEGAWPDEGEFSYGQQIDIAHNGSGYLYYLSQLFELSEEGAATGTRSMECGFWRPDGRGGVEAVMSHPEGYSELWAGRIEGAKIELVTDSVIRSVSSPHPYTGGQRLYGQVDGDLLWTYDRSTTEHQLQPYMWARLSRSDA